MLQRYIDLIDTMGFNAIMLYNAVAARVCASGFRFSKPEETKPECKQ